MPFQGIYIFLRLMMPPKDFSSLKNLFRRAFSELEQSRRPRWNLRFLVFLFPRTAQPALQTFFRVCIEKGVKAFAFLFCP